MELERQRARNIERNKRVLDNLGVNRLPELIEGGPRTSAAGTRRETRSATKPARAAAAAAAVKPYPGELEEQRETVRFIKRAIAAKKAEAEEQKRLARNRDTNANMPASKKQERLARNREHYHATNANMPASKKQELLARNRDTYANMPASKKQELLARARECQRERRRRQRELQRRTNP